MPKTSFCCNKIFLSSAKGCLMKIVAFVPIKLNNERFPGKNIQCFSDGKPLLTYFLEKIIQIKHIHEFYVFCSDEKIQHYLVPKVKFLKRPTYLDTKEATPQNIITEFIKRVNADIYCVCHCTNPFVSIAHFNETIESLLQGDFDSSFTAHKIQRLLWKGDGSALNFDPQNIPRTQDLPVLYDEIPAMYAFKKEMFITLKRRIGLKPHITEVSTIESIDIDYKEDFMIADAIYTNQNALHSKGGNQ